MNSVTACAPNRAPFAQKSPGSCGTFIVPIDHGVRSSPHGKLALTLPMSRIHASCGACPRQLLAVPSELTNSTLLLCGVPSSMFVCSSGIGTFRIGIELWPPFSGFIVTQLICGQSKSACVGLLAQFADALGLPPSPVVLQPFNTLLRSSIWITPSAPTP